MGISLSFLNQITPYSIILKRNKIILHHPSSGCLPISSLDRILPVLNDDNDTLSLVLDIPLNKERCWQVQRTNQTALMHANLWFQNSYKWANKNTFSTQPSFINEIRNATTPSRQKSQAIWSVTMHTKGHQP